MAQAPTPTSVDPTKAQTVRTLTPAPFKITPLKTDTRYIKVLVYGIPGSGKTTLAGSCVDVKGMKDVLMVNAESGTLSVEDAEHIRDRAYIDQVRAKDFKTVALVQEFLKNHCIARDANNIQLLKALQARTFGYSPDIIDENLEQDEYTQDEDGEWIPAKVRLRKYRSVIIDSLTEIDTFSLYQLLGIKTDMKLDDEAALEVARFEEFRKNNQMMQLLVRAYRDLPMNVIMACATQYNQDEMKVMHWAPALTGKLAAQVQGFVDVVGYLMVGKPKEDTKEIPRRLWIQPVGRFDAKNRIASFKDPFIDQPTFQKLMNAFHGIKQVKPK